MSAYHNNYPEICETCMNFYCAYSSEYDGYIYFCELDDTRYFEKHYRTTTDGSDCARYEPIDED